MAVIKPFRGFRPVKELVHLIASRPYDVLSSDEARIEAEGNPHSFLHVVKPEIDLPPETDHYADIVYQTGKKNLDEMISSETILQDAEDKYYVYAQTLWGKTQYGLVGCASVEDYLNNVIRKHELTRPDKEEDRKTHVRVTRFNAEPVFFAYPDNSTIDKVVNEVIENTPEYDFETQDGVRHSFWIVSKSEQIKAIEEAFLNEVPYTYVADGHHRTAAAARVGEELKKENDTHSGDEDYNYFLAVHFPASQLTIIDYNRVVKDLNGLSEEEFLARISENFKVTKVGQQIAKPSRLHELTMYLKGEWYILEADPASYDDNDPIDCLDVTVLSKSILEPVLDIKDLRKSTRIEFVGGIRGLDELVRRVDSGEMAVAFALYPVSMDQLITIADTGNIMPPKTTWFEPKLRSGLVMHQL